MRKPRYELICDDTIRAMKRMPAASVHCIVSSSPYWGLRDYGVDGQHGLEPTPESYVANQVQVFREARRVLRGDGTLWLNLGDSYQSAKGQSGGFDPKQPARRHGLRPNDVACPGLKAKDLVGIPWRVAFALQADGWYLRDCIIWHKPNPMPGSMKDRTCTSHEYIFLFAKSPRYYFDQIAISEKSVMKSRTVRSTPYKAADQQSMGAAVNRHMEANGGREYPERRNPRSVWTISSRSYKEAHFATFPIALPTRCIKAGTSEAGCCPLCGTPWHRVTRKIRVPTRPGTNSKVPAGWQTGCGSHDGIVGRYKADSQTTVDGRRPNVVGNRDPQRHVTRVETLGRKQTCDCPDSDPVPCVVLDPYNGAASTGCAALHLGRDYLGIELNPEYVRLSKQRLRPFSELLF